MTDAVSLNTQRDATALIQAALRQDHRAMAYLITTIPNQELAALAGMCALFAAQKCHELAQLCPDLDYDNGLNTIALYLAQATPST